MIYNLLEDKYIKDLKKKITVYFWTMIFLMLLGILLAVLIFCFQTRKTMMIFIWLGTFLISFIIIAISFIYFTLFEPKKKVLQKLESAKTNSLVNFEFLVTDYIDNYVTYEGFDVIKIMVRKIDSKVDLTYFLKAEEAIKLEIGKYYEMKVVDRLILSIKEKKQDE